MIDESTILIFCPCWGDKHRDYLRRFALPSLMQPGNLPACNYSRIFVRVSTLFGNADLFPFLIKGFGHLPVQISIRNVGTEGEALLGGLIEAVKECLQRNCRMILMMPDTIFANGGIANMREYARGNGVSVAGYHLRVADEPPNWRLPPNWIIRGTESIESGELVRFAFDHPHQSLSSSFSDRDNSTYTGGIGLRRTADGLTTLIHYIPTVYLACFTESDLRFFERAQSFRSYDHDWNPHLLSEGRFRLLGCSELFFAAELTEPDRNTCPITPGSKFEEHSEQGPSFMRSFVGCLHG